MSLAIDRAGQFARSAWASRGNIDISWTESAAGCFCSVFNASFCRRFSIIVLDERGRGEEHHVPEWHANNPALVVHSMLLYSIRQIEQQLATDAW